MKATFDRLVNEDEEDHGAAVILEFDDGEDSDTGMFVRVQSWDSGLEHEAITKFRQAAREGRVRVTVEIV